MFKARHTRRASTVGEIARRLTKPLHRVEYVIRARGIEPLVIDGNSRVFSDEAVVRIKKELERIEGVRGLDLPEAES